MGGWVGGGVEALLQLHVANFALGPLSTEIQKAKWAAVEGDQKACLFSIFFQSLAPRK